MRRGAGAGLEGDVGGEERRLHVARRGLQHLLHRRVCLPPRPTRPVGSCPPVAPKQTAQGGSDIGGHAGRWAGRHLGGVS